MNQKPIDDIKKSFRAVNGYKNRRNEHQQRVYDYITRLSKKPANRKGEHGMICPYETVAQSAVRDMLNKLLELMDSMPSDEEQKTQIKTK